MAGWNDTTSCNIGGGSAFGAGFPADSSIAHARGARRKNTRDPRNRDRGEQGA
jgi:hypothetical protein